MWAALLFKTLIKVGKLTFQDARGKVHVFEGLPGPNVAIRSHSLALERRILFTPKLAIGEGYVSGELEITDGSLFEFLDLCMANVRYLDDMPGQGWAEFRRRLIALWRSYNPISLAAPKVRHHYDLKDSLFDLFLDSDRQYSCAYFRTPNDSLAQAQEQKKRHIAAKLCLEDGQKVLDIGSGWGGLALSLARYRQIEIDGVTLSREQHRYSQERANDAGVADHVRFHLQDYRQVAGKFDRIVSIGMLEHVGPRHYGEYYRTINNLLTDQGVALIHSIAKFHSPTPLNPWMDKYIFPGAYTPSLAEQTRAIEKAGLLITDVEILRIHYADTLKAWRRRFHASIDAITDMYDDEFCRMWDFYLAGCEAAFRRGELMVFQIQLTKSVDTVPITRDYISEFKNSLPTF